MKKNKYLLAALLVGLSMGFAKSTLNEATPAGVKLDGELKRWHKVTLTCDGPNTSEDNAANPFMNYRCEAVFTHSSGSKFTVPGYYAACDDPTSGCNSGNKWKIHFSPNLTGNWSYTLNFKTGSKVAVNGGGLTADFFDGKTGDFTIAESDKVGRDFRAADKGQLKYVGEHYLRFSGTGGNTPNGKYFVKAGADSPENMLAYNDFDATPNRGNLRKSWQPHQQDYKASEASIYTWGSGKGTELLGCINYLSTKGVNAFSFLTFSLGGDDENVFPHLMKVTEATYNGYNDAQQWSNGVHHDRFDVSKLAQWERIFEYADTKGMFMHFKTFENENDNLMDGDNFGDERKIYYRELIARFGHHMALNWNLTEETTLKEAVIKQTLAYLKSTDPYGHHRVLHTFPNEKTLRYTPLLGNKSELTGVSLQTDKAAVHKEVIEWINKSDNAGKKWIVCNDEQGRFNIGVDQDGKDDKLVRQQVLWGTLMAGGMGVEYYYGYETVVTDLNAQTHRTRDLKYTQSGHALRFFETYVVDKIAQMSSSDNVTADNTDYVLSKAGEIYVVYRPSGGTTAISLPSGTWKVQWYNPRNGGNLTAAASINNSLVAPDNNDWVALITNAGVTANQLPVVTFVNPSSNTQFFNGDDLGVTVNASDPDGTIANVKLFLNNTLVRQITGGTVFKWGKDNTTQIDNALLNLAIGTYEIKVIAEDNKGGKTEKTTTIEVTEKGLITITTINDTYLEGPTENNLNTEDLRVEAINRVIYLMFDISDVDFSTTLEQAQLELSVSTDGGSGTLNIYQVANGWDENSIDGTNKPAKLSNTIIATKSGNYTLENKYLFNVASANFTGSQISFAVEMVSGGNDVSFASKESNAATGPKLILRTKGITGVSTLEEQSKISVYPNPSETGVFHISQSISYEVFDLFGNLVLSAEGDTVDLANLTKGTYLLKSEGFIQKIVNQF
jgi:hypothetical protein